MSRRPATDKPKIDSDVDDNDRGSKDELNLAGQAWRINDVKEIVLDEAFGVARLTCPDAKVVFEIGEGADAISQLYKERPGRQWKMNKWHPAPPHGEHSAEKGKQDECQVEQEDGVSGKTEMHEKVHNG
ncbi:MAG: hypothetical protein A3E79_15145 [Burkholderiales bacterium RIFCSPHIGHO2_12_FULL_61_11]|nr:MAG: hypothetical protein A3E79_15145 [Burkholderiales bacterium RIFCSPHIGHO2_12_FULL_61_11]